MSFLDDLKNKAEDLADKAKDLAEEAKDKISDLTHHEVDPEDAVLDHDTATAADEDSYDPTPEDTNAPGA